MFAGRTEFFLFFEHPLFRYPAMPLRMQFSPTELFPRAVRVAKRVMPYLSSCVVGQELRLFYLLIWPVTHQLHASLSSQYISSHLPPRCCGQDCLRVSSAQFCKAQTSSPLACLMFPRPVSFTKMAPVSPQHLPLFLSVGQQNLQVQRKNFFLAQEAKTGCPSPCFQ